jgi:hypothetical protein
MLTNHDPDRNTDDLAETEIYNAIRYLDEPPPRSTNDKQDDAAALVAAFVSVILMVGLGFMLLYW